MSTEDLKMFTKEELDFLIEAHKKHSGSWDDIGKEMKKKFHKDYTRDSLQSRFYRRTYSQDVFWSKEEKDLLVKLKHAGHEWASISYTLAKKLGKARSENSVSKQYKMLIESSEYVAKPGHDFTKSALGEIKKERQSDQSKMYVLASVSPMVLAGPRPDTYGGKDEDEFSDMDPNVHKLGWKNLVDNFLVRNKAELHILPMRAHMRALEGQPHYYDDILRPFKKQFVTDLTINGGVVKIIEAHLNPQMINPLTGLGEMKGKPNKFLFQDVDMDGRVADVFDKNRTSSIIVAHPKQMMQTYPVGFESLPRLIHSTASMNDPQYIENRMGRLAAESHTLGFLILEIKGRKFWMRQVQINPRTGEFVSMGVRYKPDGSAKRERADTLDFGDLHCGAHDPASLECAFEMMRYFRPRCTVWHDVHDGKSYTYHDRKKRVTRIRRPDCFKSLKAEGEVGRQVLSMIDEVNKEVGAEGYIIDGSNHNQGLSRALEEMESALDENYETMSELQIANLRGLNPLRCLIDGGHDDIIDVISKGYSSKFRWIEKNQDFIRWGVQLGQHGDQGVAGKRGNKVEHSIVYTNAIVGHTHAPSIHNGVWTNGTLSELRMEYENGPLKSHHAHTVLYDGGFREMLFEIKGEWKLPNTTYDKIK